MSGFASAAQAAYTLAYQVSPIILTGGLASSVLGNAIPIIQLTGQLAAFTEGVLSTGGLSVNDFYAQFMLVPGGNVINNAIGMYPVANQQVAANAIIAQPLTLSLVMIAPVNTDGGYLTKLAIFTSLVTSLNQHNLAGGTYAVATPAYIYTNGVMTALTDITSGPGRQQQIEWQLDFTFPLITQAAANAAAAQQNSKIGQFTNGTKISDATTWSGVSPATGTPAPGATNFTQGAVGLAGAVNSFLSGAAGGSL